MPIPAILGAAAAASGAGAGAVGSIGAGLAGAGAGVGSAGTAAGIAGAAGSTFDALGSLGLGIASLIMQRRANYQARADQQAYLEWLSPANQMMLRRMAGLNPYGDFQAANGNYSPVNTAAGVGDIMSGMQNSLHVGSERIFNAIANRISLKQLRLQEKQLDLDTKRVQNETNLANANESKITSETLYQDLINWITENTKGYQVSSVRNNLLKLAEEVKSLMVSNKYLPERLSNEVENLVKDLEVKGTVIELNKAQRSKLVSEVKKMAEEIGLIKAQTSKTKAETKYTVDKNYRESELFANVTLPQGLEQYYQDFFNNDVRHEIENMIRNGNPGEKGLGYLFYALYNLGEFLPIKGLFKK